MSRVIHSSSKKTSVAKLDLHIGQRFVSVNRSMNRLVLAIAATLLVSACSVSNSLSTVDTQDEIITSSVTKPAKTEGINSTDAELIKTVVADSDQIDMLAWQNPDTGNKGTITAINEFVGSHGQQCKKFQTTVDTFMGISLYNGETCELRKGFWVLSWFLREDS